MGDEGLFWDYDAPAAKPAPAPAQSPAKGSTAAKKAEPSKTTPAKLGAGLAASPSAATAGKKKGSKNAFGGPVLSADFETWCREEMTKLTGSDDITLVSFLNTLDSPNQIREYLHQYLGDSPAVEQFYNNFLINRDFDRNKGVTKVASTAAASPVAAATANKKKKTSAKKKVDPSMLGFTYANGVSADSDDDAE
eukprot:TRINITY_DN1212_c0_g1_i9.p1 TRINITY_DN1212_c0_g1~~TRINITY_DN1212_c0_g1_i9.p1  ORF type:complete len:202 (-),score=96.61 TRINITY_DN1212_c0_g1_i9:112-693(-)